ncbi:hypothetical protein ACFLT7_00015 [candidate division KSB1 bacterium]
MRFIWLLIAMFLMCIPAFRDYSKFFPSRYEVEVFFDNDGLIKATKQFTREELAVFNIPEDWYRIKAHYFDSLNSAFRRSVKLKSFFGTAGEKVYGEGELKIDAAKIAGWQKYHVADAEVTVGLYSVSQKGEKKQVLTKLAMKKTSNNYIALQFSDIYYKFVKIFEPEFNPVDRLDLKNDRIEYNSLIVITKLRFFPVLRLSESVIFIRDVERKRMIPVGYAIYRPQ